MKLNTFLNYGGNCEQALRFYEQHLGGKFKPMRSAYLTLTADTAADAERIWRLLSDGGEVLMRFEETFFAERFGQVRDRFGTSWMVMALKPMA